LALHVGRVVSAEHLIEALWGDDPPTAVRNGLQGLASKLRRALGSSDLVVMRGDGYALDLPPEAIDVARFELRAAEGRALAAAGELRPAVHRLAVAGRSSC
jgi:DNA-binding SARP family transcriptional activator